MDQIADFPAESTPAHNDPHPDARDHLQQARRAALEGDAAAAAAGVPFYRVCADHIVAALNADRTLKKKTIAEELERSAAWITAILKWRERGCPVGGPHAEGNARRKQKKGKRPSVKTEAEMVSEINHDLGRLCAKVDALSDYVEDHPNCEGLEYLAENYARHIADRIKALIRKDAPRLPPSGSADEQVDRLLALWKSGRNKYDSFFAVLHQVSQQVGEERMAKWCVGHLRLGVSAMKKATGALKEPDQARVKAELSRYK